MNHRDRLDAPAAARPRNAAPDSFRRARRRPRHAARPDSKRPRAQRPRRDAMAEGAVCVWVTEMRIRSAGNPVRCAARALVSSSSGRGIMQLSTTPMASSFSPSFRTNRPGVQSGLHGLRGAAVKPPLITTGSSRGVTSTAVAPAENRPCAAGSSTTASRSPLPIRGATREQAGKTIEQKKFRIIIGPASRRKFRDRLNRLRGKKGATFPRRAQPD